MSIFQDRQLTVMELFSHNGSRLQATSTVITSNTTFNTGGSIQPSSAIPVIPPDLSKPLFLPPSASKVFSKFLYENKEAIVGILFFGGLTALIVYKLKKENDEENARMN